MPFVKDPWFCVLIRTKMMLGNFTKSYAVHLISTSKTRFSPCAIYYTSFILIEWLARRPVFHAHVSFLPFLNQDYKTIFSGTDLVAKRLFPLCFYLALENYSFPKTRFFFLLVHFCRKPLLDLFYAVVFRSLVFFSASPSEQDSWYFLLISSLVLWRETVYLLSYWI